MKGVTLIDPSINPNILMEVFKAITDNWEQFGGAPKPTIPAVRADLLLEKFSDRDQVNDEAGRYYALYHPDPNWKELSIHLYRARETDAVRIARPHIQTVTGKLCT